MSVVSGATVWQWYQLAQAAGEGVAAARFLQSFTDVDKLSLRLGTVAGRLTVTLSRPWPELLGLWLQYFEQRVPLQYLTESAPWRDWELQVSPAVLIPRPETELIVDLILEHTQPTERQGHWLDLGTGSGAIAIGLASIMPTAIIHAVDRSIAALAVAQANFEKTGYAAQVHPHQGSWWEPINHLRGQVQGMVSNPPYIPTDLVATLQPEVVRHEPHMALDGGTDGLEHMRILANQAPDFLVSRGLWVVEMMAGQGEAVVELLANHGAYHEIQIRYDWAGLDRFVIARRQ